MDMQRIAYLKAECAAQRLSYREAAEIEDAFAELDPSTLRDDPQNATLHDMLEELESRAVSDAERVAYTLRKLRMWLDNYETNGARHERQGREERARDCAAHAQDVREVIAMLDGTEDSYIAQCRRAEKPEARS